MRPNLQERINVVKEKRKQRRERIVQETSDVKAKAAKAKSIPELREQVMKLTEQVEALLGVENKE